jgi:NRAMP (natural resistance-associated macrophage protein)-like metal ion transporter
VDLHVADRTQSTFDGFLTRLAVWGPGLLVMLADTDAGNVVTAAQAGAKWEYRLLPLVLLLIPILFMVQELTVRLGVHTGAGYGELIRERFGRGWASVAGIALLAATVGSLVTEFTAVAGIGELYGVSRWIALPLAAVGLLLVVTNGAYRRVERIAIFIGLFELAFFAVAWVAHPGLATMMSQAADLPFGDKAFMYLAAAIVGAAFNPWMVFYQQSAVAEKKLQLKDLSAARWDTFVGAILTQSLTGAVLIAAAATFAGDHGQGRISSVGEISKTLSPLLGVSAGRVVFSIGVLGASLVAAIVSSLALAWGIGELVGYRRESQPFVAKWSYSLYGIAILGAAAGVALTNDLVWLNILAQVFNVFLLPLIVGFLIALAVELLPGRLRPHGLYLRLIIVFSGIVSALGLFAGLRSY